MADDSSLITAARGGDQRAYAALYRHHRRRAVKEAEKVVDTRGEAVDSVAAAFAATFLAIRKGGGPERAFRPYLLTSVRNAALQLARARRSASEVVTAGWVPGIAPIDIYGTGADDAVRDAFHSLPHRWQQALWKSEIEGIEPQALAADMALSATAITALTERARDGFRTAYLGRAVGDDPHAWASARLDLLGEAALDPRSRDLVELHVEHCATCQRAWPSGLAPASAASLGVILLVGGAVAPTVAGAATLLAGPAEVGVLSKLRRMRMHRLARMSTRVATVSAATVAVAGTLVVVAISARAPDATPQRAGTVPLASIPVEAPSQPSTTVRSAASVLGRGTSESSAGTSDTSDGSSRPDSSIEPAASTIDETTVPTTAAAIPGDTTVAPSTSWTPLSTASAGGATTSPGNGGATTTFEAGVVATSIPAPPPGTSATAGAPPAPAPTSATSIAPATALPPASPVTTTTIRVVNPSTTVVAALTPTTVAAPTTAATPPKRYGGTLTLVRHGASRRIATLLAVADDGLPAETSMTFTFTGTSPAWKVAFTDVSLCSGLPASLTGDSAGSRTVRCVVPALGRSSAASVTFVVDDPSRNGNDNDDVRVQIVAQRPGGVIDTKCDPAC